MACEYCKRVRAEKMDPVREVVPKLCDMFPEFSEDYKIALQVQDGEIFPEDLWFRFFRAVYQTRRMLCFDPKEKELFSLLGFTANLTSGTCSAMEGL